jgi:transcriptional antiterminator NusG
MAQQKTNPQPPVYPSEPRWYIVYVKSRAEKKIAERMLRFGLEYFLPTIKVMRQWSDRRKLVEVPLFNGYLFVRTTPEAFTQVRMVEGVVNFVKMEGKYAILRDEQLEAIRTFIATGLPVASAPADFEPGTKVKVTYGPLKDFQGELVEVKNEKQFVVRLEAIHQVLLVNMPAAYLEKVD